MTDLQTGKPGALSSATQFVRRRYNQMAPLFDFMENVAFGARFKRWRAEAWSKVEGQRIVEVGVGTGANFPYYPAGVEITAIDLSERMLERAKSRATSQGTKVRLEQMDAQNLQFSDNTFDTVVATLVFCVVPDPIRGLQEIRRVCKPGGKVVLLEHVLSPHRVLRFIQDTSNPVALWMLADNINRQTVDNVRKSGLVVENVTNLTDIFKLIEARKAAS